MQGAIIMADGSQDSQCRAKLQKVRDEKDAHAPLRTSPPERKNTQIARARAHPRTAAGRRD